MSTRRTIALLSATVICLPGCGTLMNLPNQSGVLLMDTPTERVYGGVLLDAECCQKAFADVTAPHCQGGRLDGLVGCGYLTLVDLPLSTFGDTLTLPITLSAAWRASHESTKADNRQDGER